ncbi:MAG TPA: DUF1028 domain-containing protein [Polyangiaceae bacterium]|nr:DUF1028 domain-containing protein [Polyangiaceae bacterium]
MTTATRLAAALLVLSTPSHATYSIVGVDTAHRQVGATATSCIGGSDVYIVYGSVPGTGVVVAQAAFHQPGRERAVELLQLGSDPQAILDELTSSPFDGAASVRQYAVADLTGRVAAFTGADTGPYAADRQGSLPGFAYSAQGNILTSGLVLTRAAAAFEASACDLPARLLAALEAGAQGGEGDSRCTPDGIPSDSAFLQVDREGEAAGSWLSLRVPTSGSKSPLPELHALFDDWRATHPCPVPAAPPESGGAANGGSGDDGTGDGLDASGCGCHAVGRAAVGRAAVGRVAVGVLLAAWVVASRLRRRRGSGSLGSRDQA